MYSPINLQLAKQSSSQLFTPQSHLALVFGGESQRSACWNETQPTLLLVRLLTIVFALELNR